MMVSKNISKGEPINDLKDIVRLANEGKSIIMQRHKDWHEVRPAAFYQNWRLIDLSRVKFFYTIKHI